MKKLLILLLFILLPTYNHTVYAEVDGEFYGKIASENVYLYSSPSSTSPLFQLPYSYFVKINDVSESYYAVTYKDLTGYVLKSEVRLMEGTPNTPYLNTSFSIFTPYYLYELPSTNSSAYCEVDEQQFSYYGSISGERVSDKSDIWYYASANVNGIIYHGYIYSEIANSLPEIVINTEEFEEVDESVLTDATPQFNSLSTGTKVLLIIAITVPSVFILFFLIKPNKLTKSKSKPEKKIRKVHHGDYFEFDDGDL